MIKTNRMRIRLLRSFLLLFVISTSFCFSQSPRLHFKHLTTDDGLSHNYIRCIIQDNQGFMWFGTFDGLNKFNGNDFTIYRHDDHDPYSLTTNFIRTMMIDSQNRFWIGTTRGLCLYDWDYDRFIRYNRENGYRLDDFDIECIYEDRQKNIWIGTLNQGLIWLDPLHLNHVRYLHEDTDPQSLCDNNIRTVFEDSQGHLWIGTIGSGMDLFNREDQTFIHFSHQENDPKSLMGNEIYAITEDQDGFLWIACYNEGLSSIHTTAVTTRSFSHFRSPQKGMSWRTARVLLADTDGGLWIGTGNEGLDYLARGQEYFHHYETDVNNALSLNNNSIYWIFQDKTGDLWIGTYSGGINLLNQTKQFFSTYQNTPYCTACLSSNNIWEFGESRDGSIWIATDGGGLNRFDPVEKTFQNYNSKNTNLNKDAILSICVDSQNKIWVGTWDGGLSQFNPGTKSFQTFTSVNSGLLNDNILDIAEDQKGNLWLACQTGLVKFIKEEKRFIPYTTENSDLLSNFIEVIHVDYFGNILIGSVGGFFIFNPSDETFENYIHESDNPNSLSNDFITSIFEEDSTTLWITTTYGLNRLNRHTHDFNRYYTSDGLPSDLIYGIEKDRQGHYWISTNKGLSRFDITAHTFRNYTKEDGLQSNSFNKKSHFLSREGLLYFGGVNGFSVFDPENVVENQDIPPVVITDFYINNKLVHVNTPNSPLTKQIGQLDKLILSYKTLVFSFGFSVLNYISSSNNQYAYMLEGFEKEWNYVGTRRLATYTNINPGKYVFRVKGSNNDGVWNEKGASIQVIIKPPFWELPWFRGIAFLLLISIVIFGYKSRTARMHALNRDLEHRVKERTALLEATNKELEAFSYSISHDLRAPLRAMDGFSQALLEDYQNKLDEIGQDYLYRIRKGSQHMGRLIDDLLKLSRLSRSQMHFQKVDLGLLVESISDDFRQTQPERKVKFIIEKPIWEMGDPSLLKVMLWNLLDNAWKFTSRKEGAKIEFGKLHENGERIYFIRDNGVGFDMNYSVRLFEAFQRQHTDYEGTGIGLTTVQRIIHRHGGRIWAEGKMDEGASFYFTLRGNPSDFINDSKSIF